VVALQHRRGRQQAAALQVAAQQRERVAAQAEPEAGVVRDDLLAFGGDGEGRQVRVFIAGTTGRSGLQAAMGGGAIDDA